MQEKNETCLKRTDSDTLNEINRIGRERLTPYSVPDMVITHMQRHIHMSLMYCNVFCRQPRLMEECDSKSFPPVSVS